MPHHGLGRRHPNTISIGSRRRHGLKSSCVGADLRRVPDRFVIVLPTYNERATLARVIAGIGAARRRTPFAGDVVIVDDNSPDGTGRLADDIAHRLEWVHVIHRPGKGGLASAYLTGFRWALDRAYTHILEMDSDLSHPPAAIPGLLDAAREADLVVGSRYVPGGVVCGWSVYRRVISLGGSVYARTLLGLRIRDTTSGFKCFRRRVLEAIDLASVTSTGYAFQIELNFRAQRLGARVRETPITFVDRAEGASKMTAGIALEALWRVPSLRFRSFPDRPLPADVADTLAAAA
jgi:dolichol-phosphate mannosyltransferase